MFDQVLPAIHDTTPVALARWWLRVLVASFVLGMGVLSPATALAQATPTRTPVPTVQPTSRPPAVSPTPAPSPAASSAVPVSPSPSPTPSPAVAVTTSDPRAFAQTGFRIDQDAFWDYFQKRGGVNTFGYPVSQTFTLLGTRVQLFQRLVMQLRPDGSVGTLNLLDQGLLPFTHINGSTFPAPDPAFAGQMPPPTDPNYLSTVIRFVQANAPDTFDGHQVNFGQTFFNTVPRAGAFPDGPPDNSDALLAGFDLEMWGLPTSPPTYDPTNKNFVYQRFQRGIMHYDAACNCTHGLLLADYLKSLLLNQNLPPDLAADARGNSLLAQWAPGRPSALARPAALAGTDLTNAFVNLSGSAPPAASQPATQPLAASPSLPPVSAPGALSVPVPVINLQDGYDVSFPQCGESLPGTFAFTILGVNDGRAFDFNPCLTTLMNWALNSAPPAATRQPRVSFYLNTDNPGPNDPGQHWPTAGLSQPRACDGSGSLDCAYDYGWYAAQAALTRAGGQATSAPWWLDVETTNTWSDDVTNNAAVLQGAAGLLKAAGVASIGVYSSPRQWGQITGATTADSTINQPFASLYNWLARAHSADEAPTLCSRTFTGGRVKLVQYPLNGFDADYACF
ncbi:MAG: hypothetical protein JOZ87_07975 [Chloroflexi bacterium]|nr:hypothetical protein [Chloroflexota bacterium]